MNNEKKYKKKIQNHKTYIIDTKKKLLTFLFKKCSVYFDINKKITHNFLLRKRVKEKNYSC